MYMIFIGLYIIDIEHECWLCSVPLYSLAGSMLKTIRIVILMNN